MVLRSEPSVIEDSMLLLEPPWPAIIVLPLEPLSTKRLFSLLEPN